MEKRVNSKKLVLKVNLKNGETRDLAFVLETRLKNQSTCPFCPYGKVCEKLPHPEKLDDPSVCFADFCTSVEEIKRDETNTIVGGYIPQEGTIEENLSDVIDISKIMASKKIYVPIDRVIDAVCTDVCPLYTPDHCKCSSRNQLCLLGDLFANNDEVTPDPEPEEKPNEDELDCKEAAAATISGFSVAGTTLAGGSYGGISSAASIP